MSETHENEPNHEIPVSERFNQYVLDHTKPISDEDSWTAQNWTGESRSGYYDIRSPEHLVPIDAMELIVYTADAEQEIYYNSSSISLLFDGQVLYSITYLDNIKTNEKGFLLDLAGSGDSGIDEKNEILAAKLINMLMRLEPQGLVVPQATV